MLVRAIVAEAASLGYGRIQFMTSKHLEAAIALYSSEGFEAMPNYRTPIDDSIVAFGKDLGPT